MNCMSVSRISDTYTGTQAVERKDGYDVDDNVLAADLASGEDAAAKILVERYGRIVFRIARWFVKNDDEAEEAAQIIFFELCRDISRFDPAKGTLFSWIKRLAIYRSIDRRKHLEAQGFYSWRDIDEVAGELVYAP